MDKMYELRNTKVMKIVYYNQQSKWGIFSIDNPLKDDEIFKEPQITVAGNFEGVYERCLVNISGKSYNHPRYGLQIQIADLTVVQDTSTKEGIINFLTKSAIKGIHMQNAKKIYNKSGKDSINIVLMQPEKLETISGIGSKTLPRIKDSVELYNKMKDLIEFGIQRGLSYAQIYKLHEIFGDESLTILNKAPYTILDKTDIFTFRQIDTIALKTGIEPEDDVRLEYGLMYVLNSLVNLAGSTGTPINKLANNFYKTLGIHDLQLFHYTITELERKGQIVLEGSVAYNKKFYDDEKYIAKVVQEMIQRPIQKGVFKLSIINEVLNSFPFKLTDEQIQAIKKCLVYDFSVLTAAAGGGKTTITKALVDIYKKHKYNLVLLSPTGKATRRLEECTGYQAQTIHKFLHVMNTVEDAQKIELKENTVLIVDEASMVDIQLFAKLLNCVNSTTKIILVGDNNQLPSVQAGNVLGDLIESGKINVCKLTKVMRQKSDSTILDYCTRVNNGLAIGECNLKDFYYKQYDNLNTLHDDLLKCYQYEANKRKSVNDLQVLTIYKKGIVGDTNLNNELREMVNTVSEDDTTLGYAINDKVMHIRNNYQKDVFNGEVGTVVTRTDDEIAVDYDGKLVTYTHEDIDELQLAYSTTIHKSQGSEYPVTFVVVSDETSTFLLIRKIIYTALSRGKSKVYLFGSRGCVQECIQNDYYEPRYTKLKEFIADNK